MAKQNSKDKLGRASRRRRAATRTAEEDAVVARLSKRIPLTRFSKRADSTLDTLAAAAEQTGGTRWTA
jgi:hypothetical protein